MTLYHYTCDHGHRDIERELLVRRSGDIVPFSKQAALPADMLRFCWFTDLDVPIKDALGLTQRISLCDRTVYRYQATDETTLVPWVTIRRTVSDYVRDGLENAVGAMPAHWWVSEQAVPVVPS